MKIIYTRLRIFDGTGAPPVTGSLVLENGRIDAVIPEGEPLPEGVRLDGGGAGAAPGFIDAHGHSDLSALAAPECRSKTAQGFTVEVCGNCGLSAFPLTDHNRAHLQELYRQYRVPLDWSGGAEYRERLRRAGTALQLITLCGHNTLRAAVAGYTDRALTGDELRREARLLDEELAEGAAGLSLGLLYVPGIFADNRELRTLFEVTARRGKIVTTHLRSEGNELLESLSEVIALARETGLTKLQISHFKTAGARNWGKLPAARRLLAEARAAGLTVGLDRYPYLESMTQLSVVAPGDRDDVTLQRELAAPDNFARLVRELEDGNRDWRTVRLVSGGGAAFAPYRGWTFDRIGAARGETPARIVAELLRADAVGATAAFAGMCGENLQRILSDPWCMLGTDESARPESEVFGRSHPRGFGSVPEFLRQLAELGFPEQEAIRRLTGLPGAQFGVPRRLAPGAKADVVCWLHPAATADFVHPHRLSSGFRRLDAHVDG